MKAYWVSFSLGILWMGYGCTPMDQQITPMPTYGLLSNLDTLSFDTLLSGMRSITRYVVLRNPNAEAVRVQELKLKMGKASPFRLRVQGNAHADQRFTDLFLAGKDHLRVYADVQVPVAHSEALREVSDRLLVRVEGHQSEVVLYVKAQDAHYVSEKRITKDETWNKGLPWVVNKALVVEKGACLRLEAGVRIFFANEALFDIQGCLVAEGTPKMPIVLRHVRWDADYKEAGGQWMGLRLAGNNRTHVLRYLHIQNAVHGLQLSQENAPEGVKSTLEAVRIRHCTKTGILAHKSTIRGLNLLIYNCGTLLRHTNGGHYTYLHCTFSNYPKAFSTIGAAFQFLDKADSPLRLTIRNSILWGENLEEVAFDLAQANGTQLETHTSIFRSQLKGLEGNGNQLSLANNYVNFVSPILWDYRIGDSSPARNAGRPIDVTLDINGQARDANPDIGAFEWQPNQP